MPRTKIPSAKARIQEMLAGLPADASYEDIQYRIYLMEKLETGKRDIRGGRIHTQEEVERRMAKWLAR